MRALPIAADNTTTLTGWGQIRPSQHANHQLRVGPDQAVTVGPNQTVRANGLTRFPMDFAEPVLGKAEARAFVEQADREWAEGDSSWDTEWVVRAGRDQRAAKVEPRVGWHWFIAHAVVVAVCVALYIPAWLDNEHFTPEGDAYLGTSRIWGFMFLMLPIGLPWSLLAFPLVDGEHFFGIPSVLPAALNLGIHALYRRRRARKFQGSRAQI